MLYIRHLRVVLILVVFLVMPLVLILVERR
jgi:hypothetical protein